jgi:hypothetical protein
VEKTALGSGPLSFTLDGRQVSVPLSALYFDARGHLNADRWPGYANLSGEDQARLLAYLSDMARQRRIVAGKPLLASGKQAPRDAGAEKTTKNAAPPDNAEVHEPENVPETPDSPAGDTATTGSGEELPGTKSRRSEK